MNRLKKKDHAYIYIYIYIYMYIFWKINTYIHTYRNITILISAYIPAYIRTKGACTLPVEAPLVNLSQSGLWLQGPILAKRQITGLNMAHPPVT